MSKSPSVLIVGAGPAGLTLALSLLKHGIPIRIIEKEPEFRVGSRGAGVMPRTLEIMNFLGTLPDVKINCAPIPSMRSYKLPGGTEPLQTWDLMDKLETSPSRPFTSAVELGQDVSEGIFRSHLAEYGCCVELGTTLVGFEQETDGVTVQLAIWKGSIEVPETVRFEYVVGADGARGVVRKLLGLTFLGETRDADELVVGDVEVSNLSNEFWHLWGSPRATISIRPSGKQFAIFTVGSDLHKYGLGEAVNYREFFKNHTGNTDIQLGHFRWLSYFKPSMRMVNKFGEGRVFIVGDAAHVHSPTGGQGMNSSVQDSFNLSWKLALVIKGHAPESLLKTYTEERLPVIAAMLKLTSNLHTNTFSGGELRGGEDRGWSRGQPFYMLNINYRWSSIVVDDRVQDLGDMDELRAHAYGGHGSGLCAGDRAPEAPGLVSLGRREATSLFKLLSSTHHTLLIFPGEDYGGGRRIVDSVKGYPQDLIQTVTILKEDADGSCSGGRIFVDCGGHAHDGYLINSEGLTACIIRPDGVIGGMVRTEEGVARYFANIFRR